MSAMSKNKRANVSPVTHNSGRRIRRRCHASRAVSTACGFGNRLLGLGSRHRSTIAASPGSTPGTVRCAFGFGELRMSLRYAASCASSVPPDVTSAACDLVAVRRFAGEHAVHHRAERVHVPARVGRRGQVGLFGRHVEQRAQRRRHLVREPRLPEVRQPRLAVVIEQDVRGLQVAVQNALVVRVDQRDGDLAEHSRPRRERRAGARGAGLRATRSPCTPSRSTAGRTPSRPRTVARRSGRRRGSGASRLRARARPSRVRRGA